MDRQRLRVFEGYYLQIVRKGIPKELREIMYTPLAAVYVRRQRQENRCHGFPGWKRESSCRDFTVLKFKNLFFRRKNRQMWSAYKLHGHFIICLRFFYGSGQYLRTSSSTGVFFFFPSQSPDLNGIFLLLYISFFSIIRSISSHTYRIGQPRSQCGRRRTAAVMCL